MSGGTTVTYRSCLADVIARVMNAVFPLFPALRGTQAARHRLQEWFRARRGGGNKSAKEGDAEAIGDRWGALALAF